MAYPYPTIEEQIEAVKRNFDKISGSKEATLEFLIRAGIIKEGEIKELPKKKE